MELLWNRKEIGRYLLTSEDGPHLRALRLAVLPLSGASTATCGSTGQLNPG